MRMTFANNLKQGAKYVALAGLMATAACNKNTDGYTDPSNGGGGSMAAVTFPTNYNYVVNSLEIDQVNTLITNLSMTGSGNDNAGKPSKINLSVGDKESGDFAQGNVMIQNTDFLANAIAVDSDAEFIGFVNANQETKFVYTVFKVKGALPAKPAMQDMQILTATVAPGAKIDVRKTGTANTAAALKKLVHDNFERVNTEMSNGAYGLATSNLYKPQ